MMMMVVGGGSRYPFTASQWQELELQALIFKYMVSGIPVPPDLILCIRRSLFVEPQTLPFLPHRPTGECLLSFALCHLDAFVS